MLEDRDIAKLCEGRIIKASFYNTALRKNAAGPLGAGALVSLWDARFPSTSFSLSPECPFLGSPAPLDALQATFPASFGVCLPARRVSKPKKHTRGSIARLAPPAASFKSPLSKLPRTARPHH